MYYELTDCYDKTMLAYVDGEFVSNPNLAGKKWCIVSTPKGIANNLNREIVNADDVGIGIVLGMVWAEFIDSDDNYRAGYLYEVYINKYNDLRFYYSGGGVVTVNRQYPVIIES